MNTTSTTTWSTYHNGQPFPGTYVLTKASLPGGTATPDEVRLERDGLTYHLFQGDYRKVILPDRFNLMFCSPPYNLQGNGSQAKSKEWGGITGYPDRLPEKVYQAQQKAFLKWAAARIVPSGAVVYNHKDRHRNNRLVCPWAWFPPADVLRPYDHIIWDRMSSHNHERSFVHPQHEDLYVFCKPGKKPYFINEGLGSVWRIAKAPRGFHCAPFPLELARRVIRLWCPPGGMVCDPYSGSGTTMLAAYLEGRSFVGAELMPNYFQQSIEWFLEAVENADQQVHKGGAA